MEWQSYRKLAEAKGCAENVTMSFDLLDYLILEQEEDPSQFFADKRTTARTTEIINNLLDNWANLCSKGPPSSSSSVLNPFSSDGKAASLHRSVTKPSVGHQSL
jgi:hypothetical protein